MTLRNPNPNPNAFVRSMRHIYNPIGFQKGYNFILFFIFAGALFGFALARASYMNVTANFYNSAAPGEAYWYRQDWYKIGIHIHLLTCIPASLLAVFQFVPVIRYKVILFHRINGYVVTILLIITNVGALMIARRAFGGTLATQAAVGFMAIATTISSVLAYINIKCLQIEQHRAWMLRTWAVAGGIITTRLIQIIATKIISAIGSYYIAMPCAQIADAGGDTSRYVTCRANANAWTVVHVNFNDPQVVEEVAAAFQITFGMSIWLTLALHILGVELYLHLTKAETEHLRKVSYERQLERGFKHPGRAGLTSDRFGDEEWKPAQQHASGLSVIGNELKVAAADVDSDGSSGLGEPSSTLGWR